MKITRLPVLALALVAALTTFAGFGQASAQDIRVSLGAPPGPPRGYHERRWERPGPGAIWIDGHREWRGGAWVWVGGYWGYPPHPGWIWISGHYHHGYWRPGHWRPA
jgi:hypothetical protein